MKKEDLALLKRLSSNNNLNLEVLYTYDLTKVKKSKAVRFVYLLKGRNEDLGIIAHFKGKFIAPGCFILPIAKDNELKDILKQWQIPFKRKIMLTH